MTKKSTKSKPKKAELKKLKLVYVEWVDATSGPTGWMYLKDIQDWSKQACMTVCECGFVIEETKKILVMVSRWSPSSKNSDDGFNTPIKIPKPWILKMEVLKEFDCKALNEN